MLPPDQRRHALFSETRMRGAKQPSFCGAGMRLSRSDQVARRAKRGALRSKVARGRARALLIGVDKTCDGQYCPEVNAGFLPRKE